MMPWKLLLQEVTEKRRKVMKEFNKIRAVYKEAYDGEAQMRASLRRN